MTPWKPWRFLIILGQAVMTTDQTNPRNCSQLATLGSDEKAQARVIWTHGKQGFPNPIDVHDGTRIKLRRTLMGISLAALAEAIGLTFQQVQKYESGAKRVSSSRLVDIANAPDVTVAYFFQKMTREQGQQTPSMLLISNKLPDIEREKDLLARREMLDLMRAYYRLSDPIVRRRIAELTKTAARA